MVASNKTVLDVANILRKYVAKDQLNAMMEELLKVKGNTSFLDTVALVAREVNVHDR